MKCPQCKTLNRRASSGTKCTKCGYRFAFSPKSDQMTDRKFLTLLHKVSHHNKLFYTEAQLYPALRPAPLIGSIMGIIVLAAMLAFGLSFFLDLILWLPLVLIGAATAIYRARHQSLHASPLPQLRKKLQHHLKAWQQSNGPLKNLITQPSLLDPPPQWQEADIYAYGAERLLIVERMLLVDWLVKNNFHSQARVLILTEQGYPDYLLPLARKLLAQRPDLPVFLLHDAPPAGTPSMEQRVRQKKLFPLAQHPIIDLGLGEAEIQQSALLRTLRNQDRKTALPVDLLPYAQLSLGLTAALASGVALAAVMPPTSSSGDGSDADFG